MRSQPTQAEKSITEELLSLLTESGNRVDIIERETHDRPDILFLLNGAPIACECIQIPSEYIYRNMFRKIKDGDKNANYSFIWPNEPHSWMTAAIKNKSVKIEEYKRETAAKEVWLAVHAPPQINQAFLDSDEQWVKRALKHGSKCVDHEFERVFFWSPQHGLTQIYERTADKGKPTLLKIDFSNGYPTLCINRFSIPITTPHQNQPSPAQTTYSLTKPIVEVVKPIDPNYSKHPHSTRDVDYVAEILAWNDRVEINVKITFKNPDYVDRRSVGTITSLIPGQTYFAHFLHEYRAPQLLNTDHAIEDGSG